MLDKEDADLTTKEYEKEVLTLMTSQDKNILLDEDLACITSSFVIEPQHVKNVIYAHNELRLQLSELETKNMLLEVQVNDLRDELKGELEKEAPNIEEITQRLAQGKIDEVKRQYEHERDQMIKDLQNRVEKVLRLEMELDEVKDAYRVLESSLTRDEQQYKMKA